MRRSLFFTRHSLFFLSLFAVAACSFDYGEAKLKDSMEENIPNSILSNFEHTVVDKGQVIFRLNAKEASVFDSLKQTKLSGVSFAEYERNTGKALTSGRASSAIFFTNTESAELSGEILFYSKRNEAALEGGYLYWDNERKTLEGRRDRLISITKDDGSIIRGEGFTANARKRSFSFSGRATGSIQVEDEEEEQSADEADGVEGKEP